MFLHLLLSIFIYYSNANDCGGWGILARKVSKEDGFQLTCPNNEFKVLINATQSCCILQPDRHPSLVPETPQDPNKYYDRSLEIGCRVAPETTSKQSASQAWDKEAMEELDVNIQPSMIPPWVVTITISCTVTIILFAACVGTIIILETIYSMCKIPEKKIIV